MLKLVSSLAVVTLAAAAIAADDTPPFKTTTKRDDDRVEATAAKDKVVFSVHSPSGISSAVIERKGDKWPDAVVLQLHLKGLECFKMSNGTITLEAAVSSAEGKVRLWKDGREASPLNTKCPHWMEVRIVGNGKEATTIPLKEGYFEMHLPRKFCAGNPEMITLSWIDFYRN